MTGRPATARAKTADLMTSDRFPTCPRCGDLCYADAIVCPECGCRLYDRNPWGSLTNDAGRFHPERVSMKHGRWYRATSFDAAYGFTCPECGGPKSRQAWKCRTCYGLACRTTGVNIAGAARSPRGVFRSSSHLGGS